MTSYDQVWSRMSDLEEAFNRIGTIEFLTKRVDEFLEKGLVEEAKVTLHALKHYLPVFVESYDEVSRKAWNDVVLPLKVESLHNPYKLDDSVYEEICTYLNDELYPEYNSDDLELDEPPRTWAGSMKRHLQGK